MKDEIKAARLAALLGLPPEAIPKKPTAQEALRRDNLSREAEAVIAYMTEPKGFVQRPCRVCNKMFAVNRANISCCSDTCRQDLLGNEYGIDLDLNARTPAERWTARTGGPEPLVVIPQVLELLGQGQDQSGLSA